MSDKIDYSIESCFIDYNMMREYCSKTIKNIHDDFSVKTVTYFPITIDYIASIQQLISFDEDCSFNYGFFSNTKYCSTSYLYSDGTYDQYSHEYNF